MTNRVGDTFFQGSTTPFRPINPWGREAEITDHAGNRIDWKNPLDVETYQLYVEDAEKGCIPIGPRAQRSIVSEWHSLVNVAIKSGKISGWANPHMKKMPRMRAVSRVF